MEQLLLSFPQTSIGWFAITLIIITGLVWLARNIRSNDLQILRSTNKDLMDAHEYNQKQIKDLKGEIDVLKQEVQELKNVNNNMKSVIIEALTEYFSKHPRVAEKFTRK